MICRRSWSVVMLAALLLTVSVQAGDQAPVRSLLSVPAEAVGFSSARLQRLDQAIRGMIAEDRHPGFVVLLARHGKLVKFDAYGKKNLATGEPMTKDTIFRLHSMTKPLIGLAMMILFEEGRWKFDEPIAAYIPEFMDLKVCKGIDENGQMVVEDAVHSPTVRELMTHSAGFAYGLVADDHDPVGKAYIRHEVLRSGTLQQMVGKLAKIPLAYQPGTRWQYSLSVDIQGYLVEKLSGQSLSDFMEQRIFKPLGMKDTAFYLPPEKLPRLGSLYTVDPSTQKPVMSPDSILPSLHLDYTHPPTLPLGGAGLVSTVMDYARFSQMILNGGELEGARLLAPSTIKLMISNHLPEALRVNSDGITVGFNGATPGFALDFAVATDPIKLGLPVGEGTISWGGYAGLWFWIDPKNDLLFVGMTQLGGNGFSGSDPQYISRELTYQALVRPQD